MLDRLQRSGVVQEPRRVDCTVGLRLVYTVPKASPAAPATPALSPADLAHRLDVLRCCDDDPERFLTAYLAGEFTRPVREVVEQTMPTQVLILWLLRRIAGRLEGLERVEGSGSR
jgi:hypothetical protein